ncbi:hypothetical protein KR044_008120, partial [Drosophila immigrans]
YELSAIVLLSQNTILYIYQFNGAQIVFKTKSIECLPDLNFVDNYTCSLKAQDWNKAVVNMDTHLKVPLRNLTIRMQLFQKGYTNAYNPFLIDVQFNMCDILSRKNYFQYGIIVVNVLKQFSNVNHSCPLEGTLIVRNMYINDKVFPIFPIGIYLFSFSVFENYSNQSRASLGVIKMFVQVMEMVETRRKPKV